MDRLLISPADRDLLHQWMQSPSTSARLRLRARVVLSLAEGHSDREVARQLGVARQTVALWRRRVAANGGVRTITTDAPGRGRKPSVPAELRAAVCEAYRRSSEQGTPRSVRDLAREFNLSPATVHRTLKAGFRAGAPEAQGPAKNLMPFAGFDPCDGAEGAPAA